MLGFKRTPFAINNFKAKIDNFTSMSNIITTPFPFTLVKPLGLVALVTISLYAIEKNYQTSDSKKLKLF